MEGGRERGRGSSRVSGQRPKEKADGLGIKGSLVVRYGYSMLSWPVLILPDQGRQDGERTGGCGGWLTGGCQHNQSLKPGQGAAGVLRRIQRVDVEASRWWCPAGCARGWAGPALHTGGWAGRWRRRAGGGQLELVRVV